MVDLRMGMFGFVGVRSSIVDLFSSFSGIVIYRLVV